MEILSLLVAVSVEGKLVYKFSNEEVTGIGRDSLNFLYFVYYGGL